MKRTLIALSITSLFTASAFAATQEVRWTTDDVNKLIDKASATGAEVVRKDNVATVTNPETGEHMTFVDDGNGNYRIHTQDGMMAKRFDVKTDKHGNVTKITDNKGNDFSDFAVRQKSSNNSVMTDSTEILDTIDAVNTASDKVVHSGHTVELRDGQGNVVDTIDKHNIHQYERDFAQLSDEDKVKAMKEIKAAAANGQIVEKSAQPNPRPEPTVPTVDEAKDYVDTRISGAVNQMSQKVAGNTARIDSLEQDMKAMGNKMLDLEDRMDGVVATSHAITNARPMVSEPGKFAIGVGMGAAGSKQALALGGAYQFNESWSASTTVNYETSGKRSNSQLSAGAGVQYQF